MRNALLSVLLLFLVAACASPNNFAPFIEAFLEGTSPLESNETIAANELIKRSSGCASGYDSCSNIGAPGLCCGSKQVCSADAAGNVACCPTNAACTGTIGGGIQASATTTTTTEAFVFATTTTTDSGGFIVATGTASAAGASSATNARSTVSNPYFPFAYIPTTYTNAAACSSAYSSCQTDVSSCTAALVGGIHGVTVSAPNGGVTVAAITTTLDAASASAVCQSLSSQACYGLQEAACGNFGDGKTNNARRNGCGNIYGMAAGVAIGMAGEMLR